MPIMMNANAIFCNSNLSLISLSDIREYLFSTNLLPPLPPLHSLRMDRMELLSTALQSNLPVLRLFPG